MVVVTFLQPPLPSLPPCTPIQAPHESQSEADRTHMSGLARNENQPHRRTIVRGQSPVWDSTGQGHPLSRWESRKLWMGHVSHRTDDTIAVYLHPHSNWGKLRLRVEEGSASSHSLPGTCREGHNPDAKPGEFTDLGGALDPLTPHSQVHQASTKFSKPSA